MMWRLTEREALPEERNSTSADRRCHRSNERADRDSRGSTTRPDLVTGLPTSRECVVREFKVGSAEVGDHVVLYARATLSGSQRMDVSLRHAQQQKIARILWNRGLFPSNRTTGSHGFMQDVRVVRTSLGKPLLCVAGEFHGGLSFSQTTGRLWAALAKDGLDVGIDAAEPLEFTGPYPFERVFGELEWRAWFDSGHETYPESAALVWSCKEAVAKAFGCGFHLIEPLDIGIVPRGKCGEGIASRACLSDRTLRRFPALRSATIAVVSFRECHAWVSIALAEDHIEGLRR